MAPLFLLWGRTRLRLLLRKSRINVKPAALLGRKGSRFVRLREGQDGVIGRERRSCYLNLELAGAFSRFSIARSVDVRLLDIRDQSLLQFLRRRPRPREAQVVKHHAHDRRRAEGVELSQKIAWRASTVDVAAACAEVPNWV